MSVAIAEPLFRSVAAEFSQLASSWSAINAGPIDLELVFDQQPGLVLAVIAQLEGEELRLQIGKYFSVEWFPCQRQSVQDEFLRAIRGFLGGSARLVEHSKGGRVTKAQLEIRRGDGEWKPAASWRTIALPSFARGEVRIYCNSAGSGGEAR
jgi:hypothetical protein